MYPVSGKVLYMGKPTPGARISLHPLDEANKSARVRPSGIVQEDGSFRITTYQTHDGAPAGTLFWKNDLPPAPPGNRCRRAGLPPAVRIRASAIER